jgi:hypothetical protein
MADIITLERKALIELIRSQARDIAYEVIDEHIDEYEHQEKAAEPTETEG